jgi:hypothetical protein
MFALTASIVMLIGCSSVDVKQHGQLIPQTDVAFLQQKFPAVNGIVGAEYIYQDVSIGRIGPANIHFYGYIYLSKQAAANLYKSYGNEWEQVSIAFTEPFDEPDQSLLRCDSFDDDSHADSFVGDFFLDIAHNRIYFDGEY